MFQSLDLLISDFLALPNEGFSVLAETIGGESTYAQAPFLLLSSGFLEDALAQFITILDIRWWWTPPGSHLFPFSALSSDIIFTLKTTAISAYLDR